MRPTQQALCGGSQQPFAEATEPLCAHHNQIDGFTGCGFQDDSGRISDGCLEGRLNRWGSPVRPCRGDEFAQRRLGFRLRQILTQSDPRRFRKERIDDTQHRQAGLESCGELSGPAQRMAGLFGEIDRTED